MGIPQVPARVRRAPLLALRAVFAGIGRVLMAADRSPSAVVVEEPAPLFRPLDKTGNVRILPVQEPAPAQPEVAEETSKADEVFAADEAGVPEDTVVAEVTVVPEETVVAEVTVVPEETVVPEDAAPAREPAAELPLPNYDALSVASIRARLRGLDVAQLKVLLDYEAANAERPEVLGMFERRIEKLESGA